MYQFLDYFFIVFHSAIILFNSFGYIWKKTRKANLVLLLLTAGSWFILGIWHGIGYCVCTEWHWQVREHLGYGYSGDSYTHFLAKLITGIDFPQKAVDIVTAADFFMSFGLSIALNIRDTTKSYLKKELIDILNNVKSRIKEDDNVLWTPYSSPQEIINRIDECIINFDKDEEKVLRDIELEFLPTSTFQD
ncbi:MAG TPA: DUF2784 domain-containing protein, partial [Bacteroidia bacterium]|nr:DUF2784 domain-containing protein [Bacteroidia bacterium]